MNFIILFLVFIRFQYTVSFVWTSSQPLVLFRYRPFSYTKSNAAPSNDGLDDDEEDDDEEDEKIKPYGNRSLAWTKRYRRLLPYEEARKRVLSFGHRSKEDWDECIENGWQGAYVPARPDKMYAKEWVSWEEFLGIMRPYNETKHIAVHVLGLRSMIEYEIFVQSNRKRAELLRIPLQPAKVYQDEWIDEDHFFKHMDK